MITLQDLLELAGILDDTVGDDVPRERFRRHIEKSVTNIGQVRDYIQTCLQNSGSQYNRALQDLVNHVGSLIGFDVEYGRYAGVSGQVGHDGLWVADECWVVVEVKTTDAYTIKTSTLLNYINELVSEGKIPDSEKALGLYVVGRTDTEANQLEAAIVAEKKTRDLRVATVESILNLGELVESGFITRTEALTLLRPSGVWVDDIVSVLTRVSSEQSVPAASEEDEPERSTADSAPKKSKKGGKPNGTHYLLSPIADDKERSAEEAVRTLFGGGWYAFGDRTPGRKVLAPGDRICIYQGGKGVIAEAIVESKPEKKPAPGLPEAGKEKYPWRFKVKEPRYFFDKPVVVSDASFRGKLDAFEGRDPAGAWAWMVQATREVSEHDYLLLTGQAT